MLNFAANIETIFTEFDDYSRRIDAAAKFGFKYVEMWMTSPHDLNYLRKVADDCGVAFTSIVAEPRPDFNLPGFDEAKYLKDFEHSLVAALALGAPRLVLGSGAGFIGKKRKPQLDYLVEVFAKVAAKAAPYGLELGLEAVNTRVDRPGMLVDRTADAAYVVETAGSSNLKLLFDLYHSKTESENPNEMLERYKPLINYIQIADAPNRAEPGAGELDWHEILRTIKRLGYDVPIGLEFFPSQETARSLEYIMAVKDEVLAE